MILKIRNSRSFRGISVMMALTIFIELVAPNISFALTGGPAQPEFNSFTPIGTSDMVDLSSGDMSYNIPLMDVGGYPLNLAYSAGVGMDQEASWVGLGWDLSVGQINRNVRGLPDDFSGDEMQYENFMKANVTVGANGRFSFPVVGIEPGEFLSNADTVSASVGLSIQYNNYNGFTVKPSAGFNASVELTNNVSVGFNGNVESGPDGLSVSPSVSLHKKVKDQKNRMNSIGGSAGVSMNSRQGLSSVTLNASSKSQARAHKGKFIANGGKKNGGMSVGSTIGFADEIYTPSKRVGMATQSFTVNAGVAGVEMFGAEGQLQLTAFGTIMTVQPGERDKKLPAYGYSNTQDAGLDAILDFNREKDGSVSKNTTNLPITNYTYDIYSVQGQGVSGTYRPFRNQVGYVYDSKVVDGSEAFSLGAEFGTGNAFHLGVDFEVSKVVSRSGKWWKDNYMLPYLTESGTYAPEYEDVHYKNVGDLSADRDFDGMFSQTGDYEPVRVAWNVNGNKFNRKAQNSYKKKIDGQGHEVQLPVNNKINRSQRQARNQAIVNLTKHDLTNGIGFGPVTTGDYTLPSHAKDHHINEVQIIRNDGARYIYGVPAYNITKREATFSVNDNGNCTTGLVEYDPHHVNNPSELPNDKFLDRTTTPAYVHTHLLSSVLSTDYQDRNGDGPTKDDFGSYTKFTYQTMHDEHSPYQWRVPYMANTATYNEGFKTDDQDDRGNYVFGQKEMILIKKIETKTHVAIFDYTDRKDAHGVLGEQGGIDMNADSYQLDKVSLYSIEEFYDKDASGNDILATNPTAIKVAHFVYDYSLCKGVPTNKDNYDSNGNYQVTNTANEGGKLTLKRVYFTYRNSNMGKYADYEFEYDASRNYGYNIKGYDSWGNYKPNNGNCENISSEVLASEFPFTEQNKTKQDEYSSAWSLTKIDLPSGGSINVEYESDDYLFVQNKRAMRMFKIAGAGSASDVAGNVPLMETTELFGGSGSAQEMLDKPFQYLYIEVNSDADIGMTKDEIVDTYLGGDINQPIYFRSLMNMTPLGYSVPNAGKYDYVTGYFEYESDETKQSDGDLKISPANSKRYLSIPVRLQKKEGGLINSTGATNKVHPMSKAAWHFGRKYLNNHVYSNQPNGDTGTGGDVDVEEIVTDLFTPNIINNVVEVFTGPNATLENKNIGRKIINNKSWIRLQNPTKKKLGGGCRVKSVRMSDVWEEMNPNQGDYQTMNYGQSYRYTRNGEEDGISTGVATYEPVGNKENPFVQPVFATTKKLLAPDEENFVEMPFGESFFPSPTITYAKVTVSNLDAGAKPSSADEVKALHKTGSVVTEFYTSRDYPTIVDQTIMEAKEDQRKALASILNVNVRKHFTASQGYTIHLNDMNGKQKAQWVYAEGQESAISGVKYLYDNHSTPNQFSAASVGGDNKGKLNNNVVVIRPDGTVGRETIGVEADIVNDFRENTTSTEVPGINANLATFFVGIIPGIVPMPLPDYSRSEDKLRTAVTTKVINTFGILKETVAYDAGASVKTRNLAWDERTGEVLLTETVDEYDDNYYTLNYPAHWYYDGMGQAADNLLFESDFTELSPGVFKLNLPAGYTTSDFLIPGDEVFAFNAPTTGTNKYAWVNNVSGNTFTMIDENGTPLSGISEDNLKVVRSGKRNLQSAGIMNVTLMRNPLLNVHSGTLVSQLGTGFLKASSNDWANWRIINAGAVDYSDVWDSPCECGVEGGISNPYRMNERGVWRTKSSRTYLTGRNHQAEITPRRQGFFNGFSPMYQQSNYGNWIKDFTDWTFVAEVETFSPYGFELENKDALDRSSAAQYGYNNTFPMAVGANTKYSEIGFDGFEDYGFDGCESNAHFNFRESIDLDQNIATSEFHTGKHSLRVGGNSRVTMSKQIDCPPTEQP